MSEDFMTVETYRWSNFPGICPSQNYVIAKKAVALCVKDKRWAEFKKGQPNKYSLKLLDEAFMAYLRTEPFVEAGTDDALWEVTQKRVARFLAKGYVDKALYALDGFGTIEAAQMADNIKSEWLVTC